MSDIRVRRDDVPARPQGPAYFDPTRFARQFFGWDPFREMAPVPLRGESEFMPAFDVKETKEGYVFKADLPGVKDADVEITLTGNRLTISGKREAEKTERSDTLFTFERSFGSFARSFTLPDSANPEATHAELRDGVLTVHVGRRPEAAPRRIDLRAHAK